MFIRICVCDKWQSMYISSHNELTGTAMVRVTHNLLYIFWIVLFQTRKNYNKWAQFYLSNFWISLVIFISYFCFINRRQKKWDFWNETFDWQKKSEHYVYLKKNIKKFESFHYCFSVCQLKVVLTNWFSQPA